MADLVFILIATTVIITAFWVVTAKNLIRAAVSLMGTLFGIAGLYVFLYADFLAATQVIIYVGGILVLIIFGVMLTHKISSPTLVQTAMPNRLMAGFTVFFVFLGLVALMFRTPWHEGVWSENTGTVEYIGSSLLTKYLIHFEVAGVLLLVALLGAAYLSRKKDA